MKISGILNKTRCLQQKHDDIDNLWIIKLFRKIYLSHNDPECQKPQMGKDDIKTNIDYVEGNL